MESRPCGWKTFAVRFAVLAVMLYLVFGVIFGVIRMENNDMHPRISAGDLLLYYRLPGVYGNQDVVVFSKADERQHDSRGHGSAGEDGEEAVGEDGEEAAGEDTEKDTGDRSGKKDIYVGRIVARAGDTVEITEDAKLKINGSIVVENDIYNQTPAYEEGVSYPLTLEADEYFVLGDHREGAKDSRYLGAVSTKEIKGKVITVVRRTGL